MLFRMLTLEWVGVSAVGQRYFFHNLSPASLAQRGCGWKFYLVAPTPTTKSTQVGFCLSGEWMNFLIYLSFEIA